jgi:Raf kinase inhibitor-like YbhB/YbcL family protein
MELTSTAFGDGEEIPRAHSRDGGDASPPLTWSGAPEGTKAFALVCDDPDAPRATPWVHWVLADLPASATGLPGAKHGASKDGVPGRNDFGELGYGGPAPPLGHGTHHYHFRLYALDQKLGVSRGVTKDELLRAMKGHVLAEARLTGTYRRD